MHNDAFQTDMQNDLDRYLISLLGSVHMLSLIVSKSIVKSCILLFVARYYWLLINYLASNKIWF